MGVGFFGINPSDDGSEASVVTTEVNIKLSADYALHPAAER